MKTIHALRFATLLLILTATAPARTLFWTAAVNGTWDIDTTANWSDGGSATTYLDGDTVIFDDSAIGTTSVSVAAAGVAPAAVNVNNRTKNYSFTGPGAIGGGAVLNKTGIGTLVIGCPQAYSVLNANAGTTILATPLPNATINDANGAILYTCANNTGSTINVAGVATLYSSQTLASLNIADGGLAKVATAPTLWGRTIDTPALTIAPTGQLNLTNNAMIVRSGNLQLITSYVATGLNLSGGWWDGYGINSSLAASDPFTLLTGVGVLVNSFGGDPLYTTFSDIALSGNEIIVAFSWEGDADLSGSIDGTDQFLLDNGVALGLSGWFNGDFDYDGVITATDQFLLDNAFVNQAPFQFGPGEICPVPPSITQQPQSVTVTQVQAVTFTVTVQGTGPFNYQWYHDGLAIAGATSSQLVIAAVSPNDAGSYFAVITGPFGTTMSQSVQLTVSFASLITGFEPQEGYSLGDLNNQNGWKVDSGAAQVWSNAVFSGAQAARVAPGGQISHGFATACPIVTFDTYLQAAPSAAPDIPATAQIAVLYLDQNGGITGLNGDGEGGGNWVGSGVAIPAGTWFRARIRVDFTSRTWSCAINGTTVLSKLRFHSDHVLTFSSFTAWASATGDTLLDNINVTAENPPLSLAIGLLGTAVELSWPLSVSGFRLQATSSLSNPNWAEVPTVDNHLIAPITQPSKFFRLITP